jgi:transposase
MYFARHNGTAPLPVWSSNKQRHRLSRTENRQLNAALHRIALTQARLHPPARERLDRRKNNGDGGMEALRILKRRLSDIVYRAMLADQTDPLTCAT